MCGQEGSGILSRMARMLHQTAQNMKAYIIYNITGNWVPGSWGRHTFSSNVPIRFAQVPPGSLRAPRGSPERFKIIHNNPKRIHNGQRGRSGRAPGQKGFAKPYTQPAHVPPARLGGVGLLSFIHSPAPRAFHPRAFEPRAFHPKALRAQSASPKISCFFLWIGGRGEGGVRLRPRV